MGYNHHLPLIFSLFHSKLYIFLMQRISNLNLSENQRIKCRWIERYSPNYRQYVLTMGTWIQSLLNISHIWNSFLLGWECSPSLGTMFSLPCMAGCPLPFSWLVFIFRSFYIKVKIIFKHYHEVTSDFQSSYYSCVQNL